MAWQWLSWLRRDRREAHEAIFDLDQGVIAERRASAAMKDLAEVAKEKLETFADLVEESKKFEGGDQVVAAAAQEIRKGFAALIATPAHLFPADPEDRREAMQVPSDGSTASQPMLASGLPGGSSQQAALPNAAQPHQTNGTPGPLPGNDQGAEPPRRPRGRPKGSRNKPRPPQPLPEDTDGRDE